MADLLAGEGAGYALAAELNHYPGPAHALEMGKELELTEEQERALRAIESRVHAKARPLGRRLVDLEKGLDRAFRSGKARPGEVARFTAAIARLDGRLRFLHLQAHVETRKVLTRHQVAEYDRRRGYGADHPHSE